MESPQAEYSGDSFRTVKGILAILELIVGLFAMTLEVFLRRKFGQRYFSLAGVFTIYLLVTFIVTASTIMRTFVSDVTNLTAIPSRIAGMTQPSSVAGMTQPSLPGQPASLPAQAASRPTQPSSRPKLPLMELYLYAFLITGTAHQIAIFRRSRRGIEWHSRYGGAPHGFWYLLPARFVDENLIKRFYEPGLCYVVSKVIKTYDPVLGTYLTVASYCLFIKSYLAHSRQKAALLDMIDLQIQAEQMNAAIVEQKEPAQTRGFSIARPAHASREQRQRLADAFRALDPRLRGLMTEKPPTPEEPDVDEPAETVEQVLDGLDPLLTRLIGHDGASTSDHPTPSSSSRTTAPDAFAALDPGLQALMSHPASTSKDPTSSATISRSSTIQVTCRHCHANMKAPMHASGKQAKCPRCHKIVTIPAR